MRTLDAIIATRSPRAVLLIRLMVGAVFLSEGIQKFLFPESVGAGRFARIGLPAPSSMAAVVACFEIFAGALLLPGVLTRLAVIPTITIMLVAIATTKIPIMQQSGFWRMAHEARTDYAMLLGSIFLLIAGGGRWSIDRIWADRRHRAQAASNAPPAGPA